MDGGFDGVICKEADAVVNGLSPLVSVPRAQVEAYAKLRSDASIKELTTLISEYETFKDSSANDTTIGNAETGLGGCADEKKPSMISRYLAPMRTSYAQAFTGCWFGRKTAELNGGNKAIGGEAFKKVWRDEHVADLERWKASTSPKKIKALAERCRGLQSIWTRAMGPRTEYRSRFTKMKTTAAVRATKDRNRSEVPIGSIYSIDPWELEASEIRTKQLIAGLATVAEKQDKMRDHKNQSKDHMQLVAYIPDATKRVQGSSELKACFHITTRATGRSEYRSRFQF